jgi:hypothetical protein
MSMLRVLSMVGSAGLSGYQRGMDEKKAREEQDEERAWKREQRDRQRKEWADADTEKQRIANAGRDVEAVEVKETRPDTMDNSDVGQPGEAPLPTAGYDVQGKRYADRAAAGAAAAAANTPQAKATRMAGALQQRSPERAMAYSASARQAEAAELQITEAKQRAADAEWERGLSKVKDENQLADFLSSSHGDMQGGAIRTTAVRSADGKTFTFNRVNEDGTTTPMTKPFASLDEARMELSRRITPEQRLAHAEGIRRYNEELKLKQEAEARRGKHEDRMLANSDRMVQLAARRGAGGDGAATALTPDATFDLKTATAEAQNRIKAMRDERAASGKPMTAKEEAIELQNTIAAYRQVHTNRFIEASINSALTKAASDPQAYAAEYQAALGLGATPQSLAAMGHKAPGGQAAAPVGAARPAAPQTAMQRAQAPAVTATPPAAGAQELPEGVALDAARQRLEAARVALHGYGLAQRQKDPQGFQQAQAAYAAAQTEAAAAKQAWEQVATRMMTAERR